MLTQTSNMNSSPLSPNPLHLLPPRDPKSSFKKKIKIHSKSLQTLPKKPQMSAVHNPPILKTFPHFSTSPLAAISA